MIIALSEPTNPDPAPMKDFVLFSSYERNFTTRVLVMFRCKIAEDQFRKLTGGTKIVAILHVVLFECLGQCKNQKRPLCVFMLHFLLNLYPVRFRRDLRMKYMGDILVTERTEARKFKTARSEVKTSFNCFFYN